MIKKGMHLFLVMHMIYAQINEKYIHLHLQLCIIIMLKEEKKNYNYCEFTICFI